MMAEAGREPETLDPGTRAAWRAWLRRNHARSPGVSLLVYKKNTIPGKLSYDEAVEEALCYGWIDSRANRYDAQRYRLAVKPRRPGSIWSALNKRRVEKLAAERRMTPAGRAAIEAAKKDGSWSALDAVEALVMPADLTRALKNTPGAAKNFDAFPRSYRKMVLYWIGSARRPETRTARIAKAARRAAENNAKLPLRAGD